MTKAPKAELRPLVWIGSSKRDLMALPSRVVDTFGYALHLAQIDSRHQDAKIMRGFGDASVLEVVESDRSGTYRAIYSIRFEAAVFVLHVFQKKSKSGSKTPKPDLRLIEERLKAAQKYAEELQK